MAWKTYRINCVSAATAALLAIVSGAAVRGWAGQGALAEQHYRRGVQFFLQREPAKAAEQLERSLELNPAQPQALKLLGLSYQLTNETGKARDAFERACKLKPRDADAWFFLGRLYYGENFFGKALKALNTAAGLNRRDQRVHTYLGLTLEAAGQIEEALREYREAIKWNGQHRVPSFRPHYCYGALLSKLNRLKESERQLLRAIQLDPTIWEAHFELAKLRYKRGELKAALEEVDRALQTGSKTAGQTAQLYHLQARVYFRMGRAEEAERALALREKVLR